MRPLARSIKNQGTNYRACLLLLVRHEKIFKTEPIKWIYDEPDVEKIPLARQIQALLNTSSSCGLFFFQHNTLSLRALWLAGGNSQKWSSNSQTFAEKEASPKKRRNSSD
jgi:hypothetical protein